MMASYSRATEEGDCAKEEHSNAYLVKGEAAIVGTHDNTDLIRKLYQDGALDKHKIELNLPDERTQLPVDIVGGGGLGFRVCSQSDCQSDN
ncbi:unnamed protein product [Sphagnum jensenii]|uniref:Uncharacterized protein n=1 Tax=Sphagnum jensenii TaxID=128206 RepID=A0ABP1ADE0_9BRYO